MNCKNCGAYDWKRGTCSYCGSRDPRRPAPTPEPGPCEITLKRSGGGAGGAGFFGATGSCVSTYVTCDSSCVCSYGTRMVKV